MSPGKRKKIRGQSVVELALTLPVFFGILALSIDLGMTLYRFHQIIGITREVAQLGSQFNDPDLTFCPPGKKCYKPLFDVAKARMKRGLINDANIPGWDKDKKFTDKDFVIKEDCASSGPPTDCYLIAQVTVPVDSFFINAFNGALKAFGLKGAVLPSTITFSSSGFTRTLT